MSCQACRQACKHPDIKERAALTNAATSEVCGCQRYRIDDLSPGPVENGEELHFVVADPNGLINGRLNQAYLTPLDFGGVSVLRDGADDTEFALTIRQLKANAEAKGKEWFLYGVCSFRADAVRFENDGRLACVYDTALPDKQHHADVMGPALQAASKSELERLRRSRIKRVVEKIGTAFVPAARFRGGRFRQHARGGPL